MAKVVKIFLTLILSLVVISAHAAMGRQVVFSNQCRQLAGKHQPFMLILKRGQNIPDSIDQCAIDARLQGAAISGIGAIADPTLGFYDLNKKVFIRKKFSGVYEVLALNGNLSKDQQKLVIHLHTSLGKRDFSVIGGHLFDARVAVTLELTIIPLRQMPIREMDNTIGLALINPDRIDQ